MDRYSANAIAENIYSRVDDAGYDRLVLEEIVDHRSNEDAVAKKDGFIEGHNKTKQPRKTTKGWELLVQYKNGLTEWIKLVQVKESSPVQLAEYAVANGLVDEPAFAWWVPFTLRKRNRILKAMKKRYFRTNQKFGIELPHTMARALQIDEETGTTFWQDALKKEMGTVMVAFDVLPEGAKRPVGFQEIPCHLIFDVKADTLQRKVRYVAGGHKTPEPTCNTYASVVSRESVRLAFMLATLNGLDILGADAEGAYLNSMSRERLFTKCGPEFGEFEGRYAIIRRALYGSKSAAASWRADISKVIAGLGFTMCRADNDVWMRPGVNGAGEKIWEYVLVYSDDLLAVALHPKKIMSQIDQHFKLKAGSVVSPERYLGANIGKYSLPDGSSAWYMSSESYVKSAIKNIETWLEKRNERGLKTKTPCVFPSNWKPELDVTPLCEDNDANYFQQQIGVLRWMVELGRLDICTEVSMLAAYSAAPRQGHFGAMLHLFSYLKTHPRCKLVFDASYVEHENEPACDWKDAYGDVKELIPSDLPEPRGKPVQTTMFVDSDHAGDAISRRSRTGLLIFCDSSPIVWLSRKAGSIETSSFGSEFAAMKTGIEILEGLRYKLRMMGVPLDGHTHVKGDNQSVIHNSSNPKSQLKKKSNSVAYHYCRERCAADVCRISWIPSLENLADMFTKSQPGIVRSRQAEQVLF